MIAFCLVCMYLCVSVCQFLASFSLFWQLLRCAYKRIVNIIKVCIERNNMQVELIRFRKQNVALIDTFATDVFTLGKVVPIYACSIVITSNYTLIVFVVFVFKCLRSLQHVSRVCCKDRVQIFEICTLMNGGNFRSGYIRERRVIAIRDISLLFCSHGKSFQHVPVR